MSTYSNSESVDSVVTVLLESWRAIVVFVLIGLVAASLLAFLATPIYRVEVVLAPNEEGDDQQQLASLVGQFGGLASMAGLQLNTGTAKQEAIATLRSRELTDSFIGDLDLLPALFPKLWNEESKTWNVSDLDDIPGSWDAFKKFDEEMRSIVEHPRSGLISLNLEWSDPNQAADWANQLVKKANESLRNRAISEAEKSLSYLHRELEKTSVVELQNAIYRLVEAQIRKIMLANVREEYAFRVIDPAVPPDVEGFVKPKRALIVILGSALGCLFGMVFTLVRRVLTGTS